MLQAILMGVVIGSSLVVVVLPLGMIGMSAISMGFWEEFFKKPREICHVAGVMGTALIIGMLAWIAAGRTPGLDASKIFVVIVTIMGAAVTVAVLIGISLLYEKALGIKSS